MKYLLSVLLILALLAGFASCSESEAVTYYYLREPGDYISGDATGIMVGETREAAGSVDDLRQLLILYLHGPSSDLLRSPFPQGTTLLKLEKTNDELLVQLSNSAASLQDTAFTLACACMAQTCFGLTDVEQVTITTEDVSMTMTRDSLLLVDNTANPTAESQ